jgi:hypothetical protein
MNTKAANLEVSEVSRNRILHQSSMKPPGVKHPQRRRTAFFPPLEVWRIETVATNVHPSKKKEQTQRYVYREIGI